eukprot:284819417_3
MSPIREQARLDETLPSRQRRRGHTAAGENFFNSRRRCQQDFSRSVASSPLSRVHCVQHSSHSVFWSASQRQNAVNSLTCIYSCRTGEALLRDFSSISAVVEGVSGGTDRKGPSYISGNCSVRGLRYVPTTRLLISLPLPSTEAQCSSQIVSFGCMTNRSRLQLQKKMSLKSRQDHLCNHRNLPQQTQQRQMIQARRVTLNPTRVTTRLTSPQASSLPTTSSGLNLSSFLSGTWRISRLRSTYAKPSSACTQTKWLGSRILERLTMNLVTGCLIGNSNILALSCTYIGKELKTSVTQSREISALSIVDEFPRKSQAVTNKIVGKPGSNLHVPQRHCTAGAKRRNAGEAEKISGTKRRETAKTVCRRRGCIPATSGGLWGRRPVLYYGRRPVLYYQASTGATLCEPVPVKMRWKNVPSPIDRTLLGHLRKA